MNTKSFNPYNLENTDMLGAKITLEEFDNFEEDYTFSEHYNKEKAAFLDSLNDKPKARIFRYRPYQLAAAFALAFIVLPTTCYAAVNYYKIHVQKDNYQTDIIVTPNTETTADSTNTTSDNTTDIEFKPVKLSLNYLPAGAQPYPGDASKYYIPSDENEAAHGISPCLVKLDWNQDMVFSNLSSLSTSEFMAGENSAYLVKKDSLNGFDKTLYVIFEKEHYLVEVYLGYDITEEEVQKIANGITLVETDEENATNATSYAAAYESSQKDDCEIITEKDKIPSSYYKLGEPLPTADLYSNCEITVENVEFFDSIHDFEQDNFSSDIDLGTFVDASGNLKQYERNEMSYGDGVSTLDKIINTETVGRKFVYLTINVTNATDIDENDFSVSNNLMYMNVSSDGKLEMVDNIENYDTISYEPVYFDSSLVEHTNQHFFYTKIPAGKTVTYHIGYFVDDDLTDNIFFKAYYGKSYGSADADYSLTDIREK